MSVASHSANLYESLVREFADSNTLEDFKYKSESWNTHFKTRNIGRRTQNQQYQINQSLLPLPNRKLRKNQKAEKIETKNLEVEENNENSLIYKFKFPKFSLVNERPIPIIQPDYQPLQKISQPQPSMQNRIQQNPAYQQQFQRPLNQFSRTNSVSSFTQMQYPNAQAQLFYQNQNRMIPGNMPKPPFNQQINRPMGAIPHSQSVVGQPQAPQRVSTPADEKDKTIDAEFFAIHSKKMKEKEQITQRERENKIVEGPLGDYMPKANSPFMDVRLFKHLQMYQQQQQQLQQKNFAQRPGLIPSSQSMNLRPAASQQSTPSALSPNYPPTQARQLPTAPIATQINSPIMPSSPISSPPQQPSALSPKPVQPPPPIATQPQMQQGMPPTQQPPMHQQTTVRIAPSALSPPIGLAPSIRPSAQQQIQRQISRAQTPSYLAQQKVMNMQSRTISQQISVAHRDQVPTEYINKNLLNYDYGTISSENSSIPVPLDRADKSIRFTDQTETSHGITYIRHQAPIEWNTMNFHDETYYTRLKVSRENRLHQNIQHSEPALNLSLVEPSIKDYENFHKPHLNIQVIMGKPFIVTYKPKVNEDDPETQVSPFLKTLKDLSGKRGGVVIIEQTAESPAYIQNVGMASTLVTFWQREKPNDNPRSFDQRQHMTILEPDQQSPFIAEIPKNDPVQCFSCNLFNVPVAKHTVEQTDFLLVRSKKKPVFYIQPITEMYCAGYLEARQKVMRPGTKDAQKFHLNFITAILINIFRGTEQYRGRRHIQVQKVIQEFFPDVAEPKLRGVLKEFADFYREQGNGFWKIQDKVNLEQQFQKIDITPEEVCSYQSMLVGHYKLRKSGVNILLRSKRVYQQIQRLQGQLTKKVAEKIEIELMKTPWTRTENFVKAFEGQVMQIQHTEDGSQIMRTKSRRGKNDQSNDNTPAPVKKQLAGTHSDLRSLTLKELREKLLSLGVPYATVESMGRWKLVGLLRTIATDKAQDGKEDSITENYSRGPRNDYAASLNKYKQVYQETFFNNLNFIRSSTPVFDDGESLDDIGLQMMRVSTEEEEEEFEFPEDEEQKRNKIIAGGDPPELVPYGVATHKLEVNWGELGFETDKMRKAAKIINVSLSPDFKPIVEIQWKRRPHEINLLEQLESFVNPQMTSKSATRTDDLEAHMLRFRRKQLLDKLRRTKQLAKSKGPRHEVLWYILYMHQAMLVKDPGGDLQFHITPELTKKIKEASARFQSFILTHNTSSSRKKKSTTSVSMDLRSDDDSDDGPELTTFVPRSRRTNSVSKFNESLMAIVLKLKSDPRFLIFVDPVSKKYVPDYHKVITNPKCLRDIEREAKNDTFTTVESFYQAMSLIHTNCKTYNESRNPDVYLLGETFWETFLALLQENREALDAAAAEIEPVLRKY